MKVHHGLLSAALGAALGLVLTACVSTPAEELSALAENTRREGARISTGDLQPNSKRHAKRVARIREMLETKEVQTSEDYLNAALVLVESDKPEDLGLAHSVGLKSAELGDDNRGLVVAAHAMDRLLLRRNLKQRYGTQYIYVPVLQAWRLYDIDPNTTDVERLSMGLPTLAELRAREKAMNEPGALPTLSVDD